MGEFKFMDLGTITMMVMDKTKVMTFLREEVLPSAAKFIQVNVQPFAFIKQLIPNDDLRKTCTDMLDITILSQSIVDYVQRQSCDDDIASQFQQFMISLINEQDHKERDQCFLNCGFKENQFGTICLHLASLIWMPSFMCTFPPIYHTLLKYWLPRRLAAIIQERLETNIFIAYLRQLSHFQTETIRVEHGFSIVMQTPFTLEEDAKSKPFFRGRMNSILSTSTERKSTLTECRFYLHQQTSYHLTNPNSFSLTLRKPGNDTFMFAWGHEVFRLSSHHNTCEKVIHDCALDVKTNKDRQPMLCVYFPNDITDIIQSYLSLLYMQE